MTNLAGTSWTELVVTDPNGLHMRPAAELAQVASRFDADVSVEYNGKQANGKSLLSICMLAAQAGARLTVSAVGRDAQIAIQAIENLLDRVFGRKPSPPPAPDDGHFPDGRPCGDGERRARRKRSGR